MSIFNANYFPPIIVGRDYEFYAEMQQAEMPEHTRLRNYTGQTVTVISGPLPKDDDEGSDLFMVRSVDGREFEAFEEELSGWDKANGQYFLPDGTYGPNRDKKYLSNERNVHGNVQKYSEGEVIGVDSDEHLVLWNADAGAAYNSGETLEQFGVQNLSDLELQRAQGNVQNTTVPNVESALDRGLRLRSQALALLQEAQAADGLKPFTVTHTHSYGESTYVLWAAETPTQEHAEAVLDCEFEPDREETLAVEDCFTLEEMTGVALTARLQDILDSSESPCQDDTPSP